MNLLEKSLKINFVALSGEREAERIRTCRNPYFQMLVIVVEGNHSQSLKILSRLISRFLLENILGIAWKLTRDLTAGFEMPVVKTLDDTSDSTPKKLELVENPESTISRTPSNVPISYILGGDPPDPRAPDLTLHVSRTARLFLVEKNLGKCRVQFSFVKGISEYDRIAGWSSLVDVLCLLMNPLRTNGAQDQSI